MAQHAQLRIDTGLQVYFCDPHSPWQRGTNENTNGLLRQYFPKGTDLSTRAEDLAAVAMALNSRPRKTLGWRTPAEALDEHCRPINTRRCCDDHLNPRWQPWSLWWISPAPWLALGDRHVQGVKDQLGAQVLGHRPADDPAGEAVEHDRQVQPALASALLGDVGHPEPVRSWWGEVPLDQVRCGGGVWVAAGQAAQPAPVAALEASGAH